MADDGPGVTSIRPPPAAATTLLRVFAPKDLVDACLGDLQEGFERRARTAPAAARRWYWRQVLTSARWFSVDAATASQTMRAAALFTTSLLGFLVLRFWDMAVAREIAQTLAQDAGGLPLFAIRVAYFATYLIGAVLAGGLVARLLFRGEDRFTRNVVARLGPLCALLVAILVMRLLQADDTTPVAYLILRTTLGVAALIGGAGLVAAWRRARRQG